MEPHKRGRHPDWKSSETSWGGEGDVSCRAEGVPGTGFHHKGAQTVWKSPHCHLEAGSGLPQSNLGLLISSQHPPLVPPPKLTQGRASAWDQ